MIHDGVLQQCLVELLSVQVLKRIRLSLIFGVGAGAQLRAFLVRYLLQLLIRGLMIVD